MHAQALYEEDEISDLHEDAPFETRYGLLFGQSKRMGEGLDITHYRGRRKFEFLHNPRLLDAVESLAGPKIECNPIQHLCGPSHRRSLIPTAGLPSTWFPGIRMPA